MFFQPLETSPGIVRHLFTQVPDQVSHNSNLNKNIKVNTLKVPYVQSSVGSTVNKVNFLAHQSRRLRGAYRIGSCLSSSSVV